MARPKGKVIKTEANTDHQGAIVMMLGLFLGASLLSSALVVNILFKQPKPEELLSACQSSVGATVKAGVDTVKTLCDKPVAPGTKTIAPAADHPGFTLPVEWYAYAQDGLSGGVGNVLQADPEFIDNCSECDGRGNTIEAFSQPKNNPAVTKFKTFDEFVRTSFAALPPEKAAGLAVDGWISANIVASPLAGGNLYTITGERKGMTSGQYEVLIFEGKTWYSEIWYKKSAETDPSWEAIKGTIDFSLIP